MAPLISTNNLFNSVSDMDGEFLLIEAAEVLPSWVTPSNAENRVCTGFVICVKQSSCFSVQVWIYRAHLHLIPLQHVSTTTSQRIQSRYTRALDHDNEAGENSQADYLSVLDAINMVRDETVSTHASQRVAQLVLNRIVK